MGYYVYMYIFRYIYIYISILCTTRTTTGGKCNGYQRSINFKETFGRTEGSFSLRFLSFFFFSFSGYHGITFRTHELSLTTFLSRTLSSSPPFYICACLRLFLSYPLSFPLRNLNIIPRAYQYMYPHVQLPFGMLFTCSLKRKLVYCCFISSENYFTDLFFSRRCKLLRTQNFFSRRNFLFTFLLSRVRFVSKMIKFAKEFESARSRFWKMIARAIRHLCHPGQLLKKKKEKKSALAEERQ